MIFPKGGILPKAAERVRASKASRSLSLFAIFSPGTNRIGTSGDRLVFSGVGNRSKAGMWVRSPDACTTQSISKRYLLFLKSCGADGPAKHSSSETAERNLAQQISL